MSRGLGIEGFGSRTFPAGSVGVAFIMALFAAMALAPPTLSAQSASSSRANSLFFPGGPGGGSSSGRFLSDLSTGPRSAANRGSADDREIERIPINVRTMADGTAGTIRPQQREQRRNVGGAIVPNGPVYQYLYPTAGVPSSYYRTAPAPSVAPAPPAGGVARRAPAGRLPRVTERSEDVGDGSPTTASSAPAPMIRPPAAAEEGLRIAPEDCVEVRLTTAGGIEWRNRVSMSELGADSAHDAHEAILDVFERGESLTLDGLDGRFEIRPSQVQSYIVGPCTSAGP